MKKTVFQILFLCFTAVLLLFPEQSIEGARNGLLLWSGTIVPTLLPFLLLTGFMTQYHTLHYVSWLFFPVYRLFPFLNRDLAYTMILGFFCGYPLGGKIINDLVLSGSFTKKEGQLLLAVCNNVSPMFTIGYTLTLILHNRVSVPLFFFCLYAPNICFFLFLLNLSRKTQFLHTHHQQKGFSPQKTTDEIIFNALHSIFTIGIYIMAFSIGTNLLTALRPFETFSDIIIGCLEITTGITYWGSLPIPLSVKSAILCAISSFGGICSIAQTKSICKESKISLLPYGFLKLCFAGISSILILLLF